jgi:hypothetical protein
LRRNFLCPEVVDQVARSEEEHAMEGNARTAVVGIVATALILVVSAAFMLLYIEWVWFRDDPDVRVGTIVLLAACGAVVVAGAYGAFRSSASPLLSLGIMAVIIVPAMFLGLVVLSHNNACFGGESLPIPDQWALWGRECGR